MPSLPAPQALNDDAIASLADSYLYTHNDGLPVEWQRELVNRLFALLGRLESDEHAKSATV